MRGAAVIALLAALILVPTAEAHLGHVVLRAERYLKLDAEPDGVRLVVSLTLGPQETVRVAQAADADGDGSVSAAEADAYMAEWGEGLKTDLPVEVDGEVVEVTWGEAFYDPLGPIQQVPGAVEMVAHVPLEPGRHAVSMVDRMRLEAFDRTDVAFEGQPGTQLVASGITREPTELVRAIAYTGTTAPERVTLVVDVPGMATSTKLAIAGGAGLVLLSVAGWVAVVRRRRSA